MSLIPALRRHGASLSLRPAWCKRASSRTAKARKKSCLEKQSIGGWKFKTTQAKQDTKQDIELGSRHWPVGDSNTDLGADCFLGRPSTSRCQKSIVLRLLLIRPQNLGAEKRLQARISQKNLTWNNQNLGQVTVTYSHPSGFARSGMACIVPASGTGLAGVGLHKCQ